jgi:hypothetical protein
LVEVSSDRLPRVRCLAYTSEVLVKLPVQLQPAESVVLTVRRHWWFLIVPLAVALVLVVVPVAILLSIVGTTDWSTSADRTLLGLAAAIVVAGIVRAYFIWYAWVHDVWIVTNQRLVDGQKRHWFSEEVSTADLQHVQDVALDRHGFLPTVLKFGDLRVQTAAEVADFILRGIPKPQEVLAVLDRTRDAARRESPPRL